MRPTLPLQTCCNSMASRQAGRGWPNTAASSWMAAKSANDGNGPAPHQWQISWPRLKMRQPWPQNPRRPRLRRQPPARSRRHRKKILRSHRAAPELPRSNNFPPEKRSDFDESPRRQRRVCPHRPLPDAAGILRQSMTVTLPRVNS